VAAVGAVLALSPVPPYKNPHNLKAPQGQTATSIGTFVLKKIERVSVALAPMRGVPDWRLAKLGGAPVVRTEWFVLPAQ